MFSEEIRLLFTNAAQVGAGANVDGFIDDCCTIDRLAEGLDGCLLLGLILIRGDFLFRSCLSR